MYVSVDVAAKLLLRGDVVGFMTDTVYGIGVIAPYQYKVYNLKQRSLDKKLIRLVDGYDGDVDLKLLGKMAVCWPGTTTFIFEESGGFESYRVSGSKNVCNLCSLVGVPIFTTSANVSGRDPVKSDHEFFECFPGVSLVSFDICESKSDVASQILLYNRGKFRKLR